MDRKLHNSWLGFLSGMNSSVKINRAQSLRQINIMPPAEKLEREQMLEMLLSELDGMVYRCRNDEHWTMEFVSEGCKHLTGYGPDELLENAHISYNSITHPLDRERVRNQINKALEANVTFNLEYRI